MRDISLSVLQLNNYIKRIIDSEELLAGIGLFGEVSNFKISNRNAYFDLKEEGASISCIMFGESVVALENGKQVMLFGRLSFYPRFGKLTFIASSAEELGKGALYQKYIELKEKLEKEGLFDQKNKKQIPLFSKKIGVVTSETGAVIHDILTVARKKNPKTDFVLFPVRVQGAGAENEIADAIEKFSNLDVDVVIVARGGGSFEDLAPFNTEIVARAIFACKKPVISAVGHETDFSISDFAADLRCATPSVASEVAVFDWYGENDRLLQVVKEIDENAVSVVATERDLLSQALTDISDCVLQKTEDLSRKISEVAKTINNQIERFLFETKAEFDLNFLSIEKSNPLALLKKGYVVAQKDDLQIDSVSDFDVGDDISLTFCDGKAKVKILRKEKNDYGTNI